MTDKQWFVSLQGNVDVGSLPGINAVWGIASLWRSSRWGSHSGGCVQIILSAFSAASIPHTDTTLTTRRVSAWAGLSVCLCKGHSYKELEEFGHQPGTVGGDGLTARNNRDSWMPAAALTSAAPVKGQELRGSDREDRQLRPTVTSSPLLRWLQCCDGVIAAHPCCSSHRFCGRASPSAQEDKHSHPAALFSLVLQTLSDAPWKTMALNQLFEF